MVQKAILINTMLIALAIGIAFLIILAFQIGAVSIYSLALSWIISTLLYKFWRNVVKRDGKDFYKLFKFLLVITFIFLLNYIPQSFLLQMIKNGQISQIGWGPDYVSFQILINIFFDSSSYSSFSPELRLFIGIFFVHLISTVMLIINMMTKTEEGFEATGLGKSFKITAYSLVSICVLFGLFGYWVIIQAFFENEELLNQNLIFHQNFSFSFILLVFGFFAYTRNR